MLTVRTSLSYAYARLNFHRGRTVTELTFPPAEAEYLRGAYEAASVILEYGSGGSTRLAAEMPGKYILSVESDADWALALQVELDTAELPSPAVIYYVNIGPTGRWGRPVDEKRWQLFYRYPMAIWDEPFFRHPDTVLIDGRFRTACFATLCLRISRPVRVLFDDYRDRAAYHRVESFARPERLIGRMAEFRLTPGMLKSGDEVAHLIGLYSQATYAGGKRPLAETDRYSLSEVAVVDAEGRALPPIRPGEAAPAAEAV